MSQVDIREVGPRDGLQPEAPVAVADRVRLIEALAASGLQRLEVAAFVSPKAVPAMAGAAEVVAAVRGLVGVTLVALVPNLRGAEDALAAGVDELTVTIAVSETYNQRNVGMSVERSAAVVASVCDLAAGSAPVDAVVSCAFGSPYEGEVDPATVVALGERLSSAGCARLTYADTTGMATPRRIEALLERAGTDLGLHLHDTRGTALVNAYTALAAGVRRFDSSVGGLGGSPFAHGAAGNLATEELVALCDDLGLTTGVSLDGVLAAGTLAAELVGHALPSRLATAGPRQRLVSPA